jgi:hypothetical protein
MTSGRDDRVLPATRVLAVVIVPFLVVACVLLYLFPGDTGRWFAWEVKPRMTPLIMGSGYLAGAYFFTRVALSRSWHRVHLGFLPITAFTVFMAIATLSHLDRFDHGHVAFWVWTVLYLTTPVLVPLAWWRNRATDPGSLEPEGDFALSPRVRALLAAAAALQFAVAAVLLVSPATMIAIWPWRLTPLTAQVVAGWFALPSVVALMMAIDARWSAIRITLQSQVIGLAFILLGIAREWGDFDTSKSLTYAFTAGLGLLLVGLVALGALARGTQRRAAASALRR